VTNYGTGLSDMPLRHQEVVEKAQEAGERLASLITALVAEL
jgi:purine nucleoside phosphorylase